MRNFLDDGRIEFGSRNAPNPVSEADRIDDEVILAEVTECIALTPLPEPTDIAVSVIDGEVLLEGRVPSAQLRSALYDRVARCRGVRVIRDRLHVDGERPADAIANPPGTWPPGGPASVDRSRAAGVAAELGVTEPRPIAPTHGPSLWWIALAAVIVALAFWLVYAFV